VTLFPPPLFPPSFLLPPFFSSFLSLRPPLPPSLRKGENNNLPTREALEAWTLLLHPPVSPFFSFFSLSLFGLRRGHVLESQRLSWNSQTKQMYLVLETRQVCPSSIPLFLPPLLSAVIGRTKKQDAPPDRLIVGPPSFSPSSLFLSLPLLFFPPLSADEACGLTASDELRPERSLEKGHPGWPFFSFLLLFSPPPFPFKPARRRSAIWRNS